VAPVGVALAVGVVLVDDDLLPRREEVPSRIHRAREHAFPRLVRDNDLERVGALGCRVLGVRVVDVVARAVGEHRVDEVGLDLGRLRAVACVAPGVATGRLVVEVPTDAPLLHVAVDEERRREHRIRVRGPAQGHAVLGLDPADLRDCHRGSLPLEARDTARL
jgi:hypothetical protein